MLLRVRQSFSRPLFSLTIDLFHKIGIYMGASPEIVVGGDDAV